MLSALAVDRARITDLDAQIRDLERSLSVLRSSKVLVQEILDSYKYPLLTLPTEIEIALASPALWRAIKISWNVDLVSTVLSRSGRSPLSIHINEWQRPFEGSTQEFPATVLPHCARWEYLTLRLSAYLDSPRIDAATPLLQSIDLAFDNRPEFPLVLLLEAPLLRAATLNDRAAANVVLPWAQLTSLTLNTMWLPECITILQKTSNLVHCELELCGFVGVEPKIALPFLESLTLTDSLHSKDPMLSPYLRTFITPALCNLQIPEHFLGSDRIQSSPAED
ncbi:hypothetical protein DFH08DRAFT_1086132 [Mycena albidolilacea]|uniref:Uncharacterized protein n=1 Tax=Mycena albidolilacea TaxID=1033008 RepID=A0AAD6ZG22_9AGAR|nr:hypothetical protein DFH08DRAFT_1086132 [Mycena albidolilacea]